MITGNQSVFRQTLVSQNLNHSLVMSLVQEIKHCSMKRHFTGGHISCKGTEEEKSGESLHFGFKTCSYRHCNSGKRRRLIQYQNRLISLCLDSFAYIMFGDQMYGPILQRDQCTMQFTQMSKTNDVEINLFKHSKQRRLHLNKYLEKFENC